MDEAHGTVETPFVVPIFAMVNVGMGLVLLVRSASFFSSGAPDASVGVLAAVGAVELIVGLGLALQMRWAWFATRALLPLNLAGAIALWIVASNGAMVLPVAIYGIGTVLLYAPISRLHDLHEQIRAWSATRWVKRPQPRPGELPSTARTVHDERPLAA